MRRKEVWFPEEMIERASKYGSFSVIIREALDSWLDSREVPPTPAVETVPTPDPIGDLERTIKASADLAAATKAAQEAAELNKSLLVSRKAELLSKFKNSFWTGIMPQDFAIQAEKQGLDPRSAWKEGVEQNMSEEKEKEDRNEDEDETDEETDEEDEEESDTEGDDENTLLSE